VTENGPVPPLERVTTALDQAGDAGLTKTAVYRLLGGQLAGDQVDVLLEYLVASGYCTQHRQPTATRPRTLYRRAGTPSAPQTHQPGTGRQAPS
jgi:hypothetical protein